MSGIDQISEMLGAMKSDIAHIRTSTDAMDKKIDGTHENVIEVKAQAKSAHKRLDEIVPHIEDYKRIKNRGIGIITVMGAGLGLLFTFATKVLAHIWP